MKNFLPLLSAAAAIGLLAGCGKEETPPRADPPAVTIAPPPAPSSEAPSTFAATPPSPKTPDGPKGSGKALAGPPAVVHKLGPMVTTKSGLKYQDVVVGTGATAQAGQNVSVHYTGTLMDGSKFDSSLDRGTPFDFQLGAGMVISGWDEGVAGMKVGGKRKLIIPSNLAYGPNGQPPVIPPNATLNFDVQLVAIH